MMFFVHLQHKSLYRTATPRAQHSRTMTTDTEAEKQAGDDAADLKTAVTTSVTEAERHAPTTDESALQAEVRD